MSASFANLRKNRSSSLQKLVQESAKLNSNGAKEEDKRFWKPSIDKTGNGYAVIRFLPEPKGEDLPWIRMWTHSFQGPGGWYIENSLSTIGEKDPVGELNSSLWNNGTEEGKEQSRKQKRNLSYISNIYVVKDQSNPENEGKTFLFKYGKKIWDKINNAMNPEFEDEKPFSPFDFWEGANFKLKIRNVENYRNYDKSEFETPAPLSDDDDELEKIYEGLYSLQEFLDKKHYKPYAELETRLNRVLGLETKSDKPVASKKKGDEQPPEEAAPAKKETSAKKEKSKPADEPPAEASSTDDDDDGFGFFQSLADGD